MMLKTKQPDIEFRKDNIADNSNYVTLFKELCESFLASSGIRVSPKMLNNLTKKALSTVFTFCNNNINTPSNEAKAAIKTDIISSSIVGKFTKANTVPIEQCLHDLEEQFNDEEAKDSLYSFLLFLYELSKISYYKDLSDGSNKLKSDICDTNTDVSFTGDNWDIFYHDPCDKIPTFSFPFYEEPGTDVKFIKDYCPTVEPFLDDFSKLFHRSNKIWPLPDDKFDNSIAHDEGFVTPGSQFSNENQEEIDNNSDVCSSYSDYVINDHQHLKLDKQTWEQLGNHEYHPEKPFASEVPETVIHFWKISNACENPKKKTYSIDQQLLITFDELKTDIRYLLFGMESSSFFYNNITRVFYMRDKLHLKTITPELLNDFCRPVIDCASFYYSLKIFVEHRSNLLFGPIHKIFCRCLYQILNIYRYSLLNISWENISYVLQLIPLIMPLRRKLQFLIKFCLITMGEELRGLNFPSGVQLLDYLYLNLTRTFREDFGFLLFHFFENCCNMYLKVVSEWMFDGCFSNSANYEEFFIDIQHVDEICRDWRRVSCIKVKEKRVPKILEDFYKDIFICGKSVNLLKIFTTRDILETILQKNHPELKCCFNKRQLDEYTTIWRNFQTINDKNFRSKERIKNKLRKTFGPEFYMHIKKVREEWFARYQSTTKIPLDSASLKTDIETEESIKELENVSVEKEKLTVPVELEIHDKNTEQLASTQTKTKKLVQFFDSLSTPPKESHENVRRKIRNLPKKMSPSGTQLEVSDKPENKTTELSEAVSRIQRKLSSTSPSSLKKTENEISNKDSILSTKDSRFFTESSAEFNSSQSADNLSSAITANLPVCVPESEVDFGNYKRESDQTLNIYDKFKIADIKSEPETSSPLSFNHIGCGDFAVPEVSSLKPKNSVASASGDAPFEERFPIVEETNLQSGNMQTQLNDTINELQNKKYEIPFLSDHDRNKLRIMSSDHQKQLSETNSETTKTISVKTPLSARDINRLKVMSSEYHLRLSNSEKSKTVVDSVEQPKKRELSEYEKNKLKVMSSEYYVRLQESLNPPSENTKSYSKSVVLSERDLNKLKVMSSEYHSRLTATPIVKKTELPRPAEIPEDSSDVDESTCCSENIGGTIEDIETISEDVSDDPVTVIENNEYHQPSLLDEVKSEEQPLNVFALENYVSYSDQSFSCFNNETFDALKAAADSVSDVNRASLLYYLAQSIVIPLRIQSRIVNEAVLRVFIDEEGYLNHLTILRNYMFLRKPEFSLLLTNTVFKMAEKVKKPYLLLNNYTLSCILQQALLAANSKESIVFERKLSLSVEDTVPEIFDLTDIKSLNGVALSYTVKWPINVLITEPISKKYTRIFKFLMQVQRASWVLKSDFKKLKNLKRGKSMQYVQIQLYRYNMMNVVRIIQEFVVREALERCWNDLVDYLTGSEISLDDLYLSHLKYINKIMQRCFLCDISVACHQSILNVLSAVLKYHVALGSGKWQQNEQVNFLYHTNFKNILIVYEEFQKCLNDVRANLKVLVYVKQRRYLEPLFLELCKNTAENGEPLET